MQELRPGLWTWTARHPAAEDGAGWGPDVRSYAYDAGRCLVFFDPLAPPSFVDNVVESKDVAVLLTAEWHRRSAGECVDRFGAHVYGADDDLPGGIETRRLAYTADEVVYWIASCGALVVGDVVTAEGELRARYDWSPPGVDADAMREALRSLLELPIELVLVTHGDAVVANAHERLRAAIEA